MGKRIQDPSAQLGAKAAKFWRDLETLDRQHLASSASTTPGAKENPAVSVPAHTTAGQSPKSRKELGTW